MNNGDKPAVPVLKERRGDLSGSSDMFVTEGGLTKREVFAKAAMQGLLANQYLTYETEHRIQNELAPQAVLAADALLDALEEGK